MLVAAVSCRRRSSFLRCAHAAGVALIADRPRPSKGPCRKRDRAPAFAMRSRAGPPITVASTSGATLRPLSEARSVAEPAPPAPMRPTAPRSSIRAPPNLQADAVEHAPYQAPSRPLRGIDEPTFAARQRSRHARDSPLSLNGMVRTIRRGCDRMTRRFPVESAART